MSNDDLARYESLAGHWRVADLVGVPQQALAHVSPIVAGSAGLVEVTDSLEEAVNCRTIIMNWGDERLDELLGMMTERSGYSYGAENWKLVVIADGWALSIDIVPKVPVQDDLITDEQGQIDGELVAQADPEQNADIVFYDWDSEGKGRLLRHYFKPDTISHEPWVRMQNYWLRFAMGMRLDDAPVDPQLVTVTEAVEEKFEETVRLETLKVECRGMGGLLVYHLKVGDILQLELDGSTPEGVQVEPNRYLECQLLNIDTGLMAVRVDSSASWLGKEVNLGSFAGSLGPIQFMTAGILRGFIVPGNGVVVDLAGDHLFGQNSQAELLPLSFKSLAVNNLNFFNTDDLSS